MANPASVYCEEQGYRLEMRTDENGTYGVCVFPDGSECEEWAFFRGECGPEDVEKTVAVPDRATARDAALAYVAANYGDQVAVPDTNWLETDITKEGLVGGSTFRYTAVDWVVTVSFPVVVPDATIYQVVVVDEVTRFRWEGQVDAAGQVTEVSVTEGADVIFEGVSFYYDEALADHVVAEVVPAVGGDVPEWEMLPEYIRFSFEGYAPPGVFHEPRIMVFPAADLEASGETARRIAANIQRVLAERPGVPVERFQGGGFLPPMNAAHMLNTQFAYFDFQSGTGVRSLTQMGQAYMPINNQELFYTFQGMTHDGKYYVAAILPISHPSLPADGSEIPGGDFEAFADNFATYVQEIEERLDAEADDSFAPNIALLDEMIQSLEVAPAR
jgi:hypothetical protein